MTHTKPPHKPFTKKFWILLSSSVLSLLLVYGGIVWAVYFKEAEECKGDLATNCVVIGKKGITTRQGEARDKRETVKLHPKESAKSNADDTSSNLWKKRLVITNADPDRNYFIPLRTEAEIVAAYKSTQRKDGKGLAGKVHICAKGEQSISISKRGVVIPACNSDEIQFDADYMVITYRFNSGQDLDMRVRAIDPLHRGRFDFIGWGATDKVVFEGKTLDKDPKGFKKRHYP